MLGGELSTAADRCPVEDWKCRLSPEHVVDFCGLVDDLVHRDKAERYLAPIDDWAVATTGGAYRHTGQSRFRDRSRPHSLAAKLCEQGRNCVSCHIKNLGIAPHLFGYGFDARLAVRELSHYPILAFTPQRRRRLPARGGGVDLPRRTRLQLRVLPSLGLR